MEEKEEGRKKKRSKWWVLGLFGGLIAGMLILFNGPTIRTDNHRKTESLVMAYSIMAAIENFYGEYDRLPDVGGSRVQTEGTSGMKLLEILNGMEEEGTKIQNPRQIIFLQGREAKGRRGGIEYRDEEDTAIAIYDSYGRPYTVILNVDKSDTLDFNWGDEQVRLRGKQVAVWSVGADGVEGTKDDAKSWN